MQETTIRSAGQADLVGVLALYQQLHPNDLACDQTSTEAAWRALLASEQNTVLVADVGGDLVATCTLIIIPNLTRGARPFGVIENVVTHQSQRRTGLGRAVLSRAMDAAWKAGCYKIMLASGRDEGILQFYERCGFTRGGKTAFEIRCP